MKAQEIKQFPAIMWSCDPSASSVTASLYILNCISPATGSVLGDYWSSTNKVWCNGGAVDKFHSGWLPFDKEKHKLPEGCKLPECFSHLIPAPTLTPWRDADEFPKNALWLRKKSWSTKCRAPLSVGTLSVTVYDPDKNTSQVRYVDLAKDWEWSPNAVDWFPCGKEV